MGNPWQYVVQEYDETYHCFICDCGNMDNDSIIEHVNNEDHNEAMDQYARDIVLRGNNYYDCALCGCPISGYTNVYDHLIGQQHQDRLNEPEDESSEESQIDTEFNPWESVIRINDTLYNCFICDMDISGTVAANDHVNSQYHWDAVGKYGCDIEPAQPYGYYCNLCGCLLASYKNVYQHLIGQQHQGSLYYSA